MDMIESILLVDDENLFHLVFEDACSLLDITLNLMTIDNADAAENHFATIVRENKPKPDCIFVDLNIIGSSFDGFFHFIFMDPPLAFCFMSQQVEFISKSRQIYLSTNAIFFSLNICNSL